MGPGGVGCGRGGMRGGSGRGGRSGRGAGGWGTVRRRRAAGAGRTSSSSGGSGRHGRTLGGTGGALSLLYWPGRSLTVPTWMVSCRFCLILVLFVFFCWNLVVLSFFD